MNKARKIIFTLLATVGCVLSSCSSKRNNGNRDKSRYIRPDKTDRIVYEVK